MDLDNLEDRGIVIFLGFIIASIAFWLFSDKISLWAQLAPAWQVLLSYFLINPAYLFVIISLTAWKKVQGLIASLLLILVSDIISIPHFIGAKGLLPSDPSSYFSTDLILYKLLPVTLQNQYGVVTIYLIIPAIFVLLAMEIAGIKVFAKIAEARVKG